MDKKISFLQVFGILLVVLGHAEIKGSFLFDWIYSFHMPLFMCISGYLFYYTQNKKTDGFKNLDTWLFIKSKFKRLLIPYFLISSVAFIPKFLLNRFAVRPLDLNFTTYLQGFIYPNENPIIFFWFLPTLFIIMILMTLILKKISNKVEKILVVSLIVGLLSRYVDISILNISGVLQYIFFFVLGMNISKYMKNFLSIVEKRIYKITIPLFILFTLLVKLRLMYGEAIQGLGNMVVYYVLGIIGIIFSFLLAVIYVKENFRFLDRLFGTSYSIYLLSWFPQVFIRILWMQILKYNPIIGSVLSFICGVLCPVIVNLFIRKYFNKNKWVKVIFGV